MALTRHWIPSPNYSSRGGTRVRLVVIHTAEGAATYQALGSFFSNPSSGVSSQTGIDDTPNTVGEYVSRSNKPWTQASANPYSTATELCAFAKWNRATWLQHPTMLENCKQWINEECAHFGIPKIKLTASQAQSGQAGVCGHVDLGSSGGGHWDPGPEFPWDVVMSGTPPAPSTGGKGARVIRATPSGNGYWVIGSDGGVFTYGDADFFGSLGDIKLSAPITGMTPTPSGRGYLLCGADGGVFAFGDAVFHGSLGDIALSAPISSIDATPSGRGYWLLGEDGGVFAFGDAQFYGAPTGLVRGG